MDHIKISDCAVVLQGKNIDKKYLNTDRKGLPYIVGASCIKDSGLVCEKFTERTENAEISQLGDVIISVVGTLGKMAVNNIGDCVLSKHVCAVRFVPQILPEYGMLSLMGAIGTCIPPEDGITTGFSRKLDKESIEELPLLLASIDYQQEVVTKMLFLGRAFDNMKSRKEPEININDLPDDPVELIKQFEKESAENLRRQRKALWDIVDIITGSQVDIIADAQATVEELQTCLFS